MFQIYMIIYELLLWLKFPKSEPVAVFLSSCPWEAAWIEFQEFNIYQQHFFILFWLHPYLLLNTPLSLFQEVVERVLHDGTDIVLQWGLQGSWWQALFTDCRVPRAGRGTFPFPWTRRMPHRWGGTGCKRRLATAVAPRGGRKGEDGR